MSSEFEDYYPSAADLKKIRNWPSGDIRGMLAWVKPRWRYSEPNPAWCGWNVTRRRLYLSTGGWSGNESLISAMEESRCWFWAFCWISSRRGGHYEFDLTALNTAAPKERQRVRTVREVGG